jgi:hypothetical protein
MYLLAQGKGPNATRTIPSTLPCWRTRQPENEMHGMNCKPFADVGDVVASAEVRQATETCRARILPGSPERRPGVYRKGEYAIAYGFQSRIRRS